MSVPNPNLDGQGNILSSRYGITKLNVFNSLLICVELLLSFALLLVNLHFFVIRLRIKLLYQVKLQTLTEAYKPDLCLSSVWKI